ncbi:MAG: hypothetical protein WCH99_17545 [Verrucomicrobiota bacterium]
MAGTILAVAVVVDLVEQFSQMVIYMLQTVHFPKTKQSEEMELLRLAKAMLI